MTNPLSADHTGDGINLQAHMTGNPLKGASSAGASAMTVWLLIIGALVVLFVLGFSFKSVRL